MLTALSIMARWPTTITLVQGLGVFPRRLRIRLLCEGWSAKDGSDCGRDQKRTIAPQEICTFHDNSQ